MAKFDESKVINTLHVDKAEVGKKYWFSDSISILKNKVEDSDMDKVRTLNEVLSNEDYPFRTGSPAMDFMLIYPYEEPEAVYVPFESVEELIDCWYEKLYGNKGVKHTVFSPLIMPTIWVKNKATGRKSLVTDYDKNQIALLSVDIISMSTLLKCFTFLDGSPIGKLKE